MRFAALVLALLVGGCQSAPVGPPQAATTATLAPADQVPVSALFDVVQECGVIRPPRYPLISLIVVANEAQEAGIPPAGSGARLLGAEAGIQASLAYEADRVASRQSLTPELGSMSAPPTAQRRCECIVRGLAASRTYGQFNAIGPRWQTAVIGYASAQGVSDDAEALWQDMAGLARSCQAS